MLRFFKILPPARSYIIIPPGGIIMYGLAGGTILKQWNFVDTKMSSAVCVNINMICKITAPSFEGTEF